MRGAVAVQWDGRLHKLNVRLRAYWGCQDMTALSPPEELPQPQTTPDTLATEPKRNCPRMNLRHYLYRAVGRDAGALNGGSPLTAKAADQQPLAAVTLKKKWQMSTSALLVTTGSLEVGCCLALGH